ncbi:MAG: hypothetical protein QOK25_831 [Thermoleophilaceae bacterium]|jgi:hypothetical protein|nr:hypothetical protein [Thermoleophilaceae bacterium]
MRRKRAIVAVLALAVALLAGVTLSQAARRAHKAPHCARRGSHTMYLNGGVRIYSTDPSFHDDGRIYGCLLAANKRVVLVEGLPPEGVNLDLPTLRVAAPFVAFHVFVVYHGATIGTGLDLVNLRTGAKSHGQPSGPVVGVGLTARGSLAWMDQPGAPYEVHKLDAGAQDPVLLDSGTDADSFAVGGSHVYWTKAGMPRSATMP